MCERARGRVRERASIRESKRASEGGRDLVCGGGGEEELEGAGADEDRRTKDDALRYPYDSVRPPVYVCVCVCV